MQLRYKGHSKWQNIKYKKAHIDFARSKEFGKLSMEIITAVRESGVDVKFNHRLEGLIDKAKSISMPKEKIESAIKSGAGTKDNPHGASLLEIKGPGGCGLIVQILTSNKVKTKNEMNTILRKNGGSFKDGGSVAFQYDHKGDDKINKVLFRIVADLYFTFFLLQSSKTKLLGTPQIYIHETLILVLLIDDGLSLFSLQKSSMYFLNVLTSDITFRYVL